MLQIGAHAGLGRILEMPVSSITHVHQGRKGASDSRGHFRRGRDTVQIVDRRIQESDVRRVFGLDVVVMVIGEVVAAGPGCDAVTEVKETRSGTDRMIGRVVVVAVAGYRFSVFDENGNGDASRRTLRGLEIGKLFELKMICSYNDLEYLNVN